MPTEDWAILTIPYLYHPCNPGYLAWKKLRQEPLNIIRIALFGPNPPKTTLSKQLAHHYDTVWVREYARISSGKME